MASRCGDTEKRFAVVLGIWLVGRGSRGSRKYPKVSRGRNFGVCVLPFLHFLHFPRLY